MDAGNDETKHPRAPGYCVSMVRQEAEKDAGTGMLHSSVKVLVREGYDGGKPNAWPLRWRSPSFKIFNFVELALHPGTLASQVDTLCFRRDPGSLASARSRGGARYWWRETETFPHLATGRIPWKRIGGWAIRSSDCELRALVSAKPCYRQIGHTGWLMTGRVRLFAGYVKAKVRSEAHANVL